MSELDEEWGRRLAEAQQRARASGRGDVAEYLALRASNDMARTTGIEWLMMTATVLAGEFNRHAGASIRIEREEPHRFERGRSTMVGARLTLRSGVRSLTFEAGWPRTPQDGIVQGGGLALARINHFGNRRAGAEFLLMRGKSENALEWRLLEPEGLRSIVLHEEDLRLHISRLIN